MKELNFIKMVASGNDFVVVENFKLPAYLQAGQIPTPGLKSLAKNICERKFGVGADGLLILEKSKVADVKMRIFNPDGSEAEMCGNGARCVAAYMGLKLKVFAEGVRLPFLPRRHAGVRQGSIKSKINIETKAGILESNMRGELVKIKLTEPKDYNPEVRIRIEGRPIHINFINTGVPHAVLFVSGIDKIDIASIGRKIRRHNFFMPAGTNVDFVEILRDNFIKIRTYERGVEEETLACGTGTVASALVSAYMNYVFFNPIKVLTKSGEVLKVYYDKIENSSPKLKKKISFNNVWLEGKAKIVYEGKMKTQLSERKRY